MELENLSTLLTIHSLVVGNYNDQFLQTPVVDQVIDFALKKKNGMCSDVVVVAVAR